MSLTLSLSKALLCAATQCWPVLIGLSTPPGEYTLIQRYTDDRGYGGDVLKFYETEKSVFAIHRVWTLNPEQRRLQRLKSDNPKDRVISKGCVNVSPEVYEYLAEHYNGASLKIEE